MKPLLALIFLTALSLPTYARLGETEAQLVARFGTPAQSQQGDYPMLQFHKTGFEITVLLINGRSVQEKYRKITGDSITEEEQRNLLFINAGGQHWVETTPPANAKLAWVRDDTSLAIRDDNGGSEFVFDSREYLAAEAAAYKKAHTSSTIGF